MFSVSVSCINSYLLLYISVLIMYLMQLSINLFSSLVTNQFDTTFVFLAKKYYISMYLWLMLHIVLLCDQVYQAFIFSLEIDIGIYFI